MDSLRQPLSQNGATADGPPRDDVSRDEALKRSRAALLAVSVELKELEVQFRARAAQIEGAQACLRLMVPQELLAQHQSVLAASPKSVMSGEAAPYADALLHDLETHAALEDTKLGLVRLALNNRRFAMVVDLMSAAVHLLDASTEMMAQNFLHLHMRQCRSMLKQVEETLHDFPRLQTELLRSLGERVS